jgi:hypothetical protein
MEQGFQTCGHFVSCDSLAFIFMITQCGPKSVADLFELKKHLFLHRLQMPRAVCYPCTIQVQRMSATHTRVGDISVVKKWHEWFSKFRGGGPPKFAKPFV